MLKLLLLLCVLFMLNAAWIVGRKIYKAQRHLVCQRPEKPAQISSMTEARGHRARAASTSGGCL